MGLTNSGATFQRFMNEIFIDLIEKICIVYLHDIIIYLETVVEHLKHIEEVLNVIRTHGLKIKPSKCNYFETSIEYLGHVIHNGTVVPSPNKIEALFKHQRPTNVDQVISFVGLASYYRKFIKDFAKIAAPLHKLNEKNAEFKWTSECEIAFQTLRNNLTSDKVLAIPDFEKTFKLASNYEIGTVLSQQEGKERLWRPIAYYSRSLTKPERNYATSEEGLEFKLNREVLYRIDKNPNHAQFVVLSSEREAIMQQEHSSKWSGHLKLEKTFKRIKS